MRLTFRLESARLRVPDCHRCVDEAAPDLACSRFPCNLGLSNPLEDRISPVMGYLEILLIAGLILINGFFVTVEFALVKVRATQIDQLAEQGNWAAKLTSKALDRLDFYLSASPDRHHGRQPRPGPGDARLGRADGGVGLRSAADSVDPDRGLRRSRSRPYRWPRCRW